jgi:D-tyrosyl-tRNA(Tyr) deacylase
MRAVIQRVTSAQVKVAGTTVGAIGRGLLILLGVGEGDAAGDVDYLVQKTAGLRIFPDEHDRMNRALRDIDGAALVISQFTLYGDCRKGRRPAFTAAAEPTRANVLYEQYCQELAGQGIPVETGQFAADMQVQLVNDGPVTILLDSRKVF